MDSHYINEVLKGNSNAFGYFIKTYQNKAFDIAVSIVKHEETAKDIVQDSFITAYSSISKFRNEAKFSTWLYRIVVNTSLQFIKKRKRKKEIEDTSLISNNQRSGYNQAIKQLQKEDLKKLIVKVFKKIPAKEAMILQLYYINDQRISEIEEISGLTKSHIKVLLHRGRLSFYKKIKEEKVKKPY